MNVLIKNVCFLIGVLIKNTFNRQPSIGRRQSAAVNRPPSIGRRQSAAVNRPPSIGRRQSAAVLRQWQL